MHSSLKDSYVRNKELKQKINFLIQDNASLFRLSKDLKVENNNLNKVQTDLRIKLDRKIKLCELFKKEQGDLKRRMDGLNELLKHKKQVCFQKNESKPHFDIHKNRLNSNANEFTIYKKKTSQIC